MTTSIFCFQASFMLTGDYAQKMKATCRGSILEEPEYFN